MSSSQLQIKYTENITELLQTRILNNLEKFDKGNNAAGTRVRVASQDLIKLLKSLRIDVLTTQKDKKAAKTGSKTPTETVNDNNIDVPEEKVVNEKVVNEDGNINTPKTEVETKTKKKRTSKSTKKSS